MNRFNTNYVVIKKMYLIGQNLPLSYQFHKVIIFQQNVIETSCETTRIITYIKVYSY